MEIPISSIRAQEVCQSPRIKLKTKSFKTGAVDLAVEGAILSRLDHKNVIIQLHGTIGVSPLQSFLQSDRGYFILLDLLLDTLASSKLDTYRSYYIKGPKEVVVACRSTTD